MKDLKANSFGLESAGVWQARGNGGLVLTGKELHFFMLIPNKEVRVPGHDHRTHADQKTFGQGHDLRSAEGELLRRW
ncbi:MAG: hypothetical protein IPL78_12865 [Chloroflexi bacterium]|nr:hypothetical protein [Chloroflexota bacterium]